MFNVWELLSKERSSVVPPAKFNRDHLLPYTNRDSLYVYTLQPLEQSTKTTLRWDNIILNHTQKLWKGNAIALSLEHDSHPFANDVMSVGASSLANFAKGWWAY